MVSRNGSRYRNKMWKDNELARFQLAYDVRKTLYGRCYNVVLSLCAGWVDFDVKCSKASYFISLAPVRLKTTKKFHFPCKYMLIEKVWSVIYIT